MSHPKSREVVLALKMTDDLLARLDAMKDIWRNDPQLVPKGLSCSETKEGEFVLMAVDSVFTTLPGACVIKGIGAVEMLGDDLVFEDWASEKTLVLRETAEGWRFSVKYVPPIVRGRNLK